MTSPAVPGTSPAGPGPVADPAPAPGAFPEGFLWGAATAAYQVEGAVGSGGRTPSIWDTFSRTPGRVAGGATGDIASDHYHHLDDDLDLLSWLGLTAYRFSVSWPRWMPAGRGRRSPHGVAFYDRLVDGLLARGIQPWATLYHWDLPQSLQDAGGWAERDTAHRFAEYADSVTLHLGDRVQAFFTLAEPWCSAFLGYAAGVHAPGVQDDAAALRAVHHLLLGHGEAVTALRLRGTRARVGIALNAHPVEALTPREGDHEAVRRVDGLVNRLVLDPLLRGDYPVDVVADLSGVTDFSHIRDGDLPVINAPLDLVGENYHGPLVVAAADTPRAHPAGDRGAVHPAQRRQAGPAPDGWGLASPWIGARDVVVTGLPASVATVTAEREAAEREAADHESADHEVPGQGLPDVLLRLVSDYDCPPLVVTGGGPGAGRTAHLRQDLHGCLDAVAEGVDLRGYFAASLLDGFAWEWGYSRRFGIVHVDRETLRRIPKNCAGYLRAVVADNALEQR